MGPGARSYLPAAPEDWKNVVGSVSVFSGAWVCLGGGGSHLSQGSRLGHMGQGKVPLRAAT